MNDWYDNIEEPVRELVRHLRNNGINTTCSCGHDMYIQADVIPDGSFKHLHDLLFNYLTENELNVEYDITFRLEVRNGRPWRTLVMIQLC